MVLTDPWSLLLGELDVGVRALELRQQDGGEPHHGAVPDGGAAYCRSHEALEQSGGLLIIISKLTKRILISL